MDNMYIGNNIKLVFKLKTTILYICFSLILFIYILSSTQGKSPEKIQFFLLQFNCIIQVFISFFITSSQLLSITRNGFDKLLFSYPLGIKKIVSNILVYSIIYQLFILFISLLLLFLCDIVFYNFENTIYITGTNWRTIFILFLNFSTNIIIILSIFFTFFSHFKSFLGNVVAISVIITLYLGANFIYNITDGNQLLISLIDLLGINITNNEYPTHLIFINRCIFLIISFLLFYFSLNYYSKNKTYRTLNNTKSKRNERKSFTYLSNSFYSLVCFNWIYIWQKKSFLILFLLPIVGILMDANTVDDFGHSQLFTSLIINQNLSSFEVFPILLILFIIFVPLSMLIAFRQGKFHYIIASTPLTNIKIILSVILTFLGIFVIYLSFAVFIYSVAIIGKYGMHNFSSLFSVFYVFFNNYFTYFFIGLGVILLYLITGKITFTVFLGILLSFFYNWIDQYIHAGAISENWHLLSFFYVPELPSSDINPYPNKYQFFVFLLYGWYHICLLFGSILLLSAIYPRYDCNFKQRLLNFNRESNKQNKIFILLYFAVSITCAFQIISIQNREKEGYIERVNIYEKYISLYKKYLYSPQPEIVSGDFELDLYPAKNRLIVKGNYWLKNMDTVDIDTLFFTIPLKESAKINFKDIQIKTSHKNLIFDTIHHFFAFIVDNAMRKNDSIAVSYELEICEIKTPGFRDLHIDERWTLIESRCFIMTPGYGMYREPNAGKNFIPETDQEISFFQNRRRVYYTTVSPKIKYTISAPKNQMVISDGDLIATSECEDRKYYEYASYEGMDLFNIPIVSSSQFKKYTIDTNDLKISVFYIPTHIKGAEGIVNSSKIIISNYINNYGCLPFDHINIIEAASYRGNGGTAYNNSIIMDESVFTYDFSDTSNFNSAILLLSHELSHFWWGGILKTSYLSGADILTESIAEYSAIQQLAHLISEKNYKKYLEYCISRSLNINMPIVNVIDDSHNRYAIHYKAPLILRLFSINIGENNFNALLKSYIDHSKHLNVNVFDFMEFLQSNITCSDSILLEELFTKNITYKNKIESVTYRKKDEKYEYNVLCDFSKVCKDSNIEYNLSFQKTEIIDITFLHNQKILYQEEFKISAPLELFLLDTIPDEIYLDYKYRYIDNPKDNFYKEKQMSTKKILY